MSKPPSQRRSRNEDSKWLARFRSEGGVGLVDPVVGARAGATSHARGARRGGRGAASPTAPSTATRTNAEPLSPAGSTSTITEATHGSLGHQPPLQRLEALRRNNLTNIHLGEACESRLQRMPRSGAVFCLRQAPAPRGFGPGTAQIASSCPCTHEPLAVSLAGTLRNRFSDPDLRNDLDRLEQRRGVRIRQEMLSVFRHDQGVRRSCVPWSL